VRRDGSSDKGEWNVYSTAVPLHPVLELLRWKKDLLYHCGNAPKDADSMWLENDWQLLWWSEIPEDIYRAAHEYEQEEGTL
jgi:hypothetical protein